MAEKTSAASNSIFGNIPPRRSPQVETVEVETLVPTPLLYDDSIDGYWVGKFGITGYGIYIREEASEREWYEASEAIAKAEQGRDWGKADLAHFALEMLGMDKGTIATRLGFSNVKTVDIYVAVCKAADMPVRIASPSFSHFRLVKDYPQRAQIEWMQAASRGKWSVSELRKKLDEAAGVVKQSNVGKKAAARLLKNHIRQADRLVEETLKLPEEQRQAMVAHLRELVGKLENGK